LNRFFHDVLLTIIVKFENRSNAPLLTHLQQLLDFQVSAMLWFTPPDVEVTVTV